VSSFGVANHGRFRFPAAARLFGRAAGDIRRLLHQFAAGFLKEPNPSVRERLARQLLSEAGEGAQTREQA